MLGFLALLKLGSIWTRIGGAVSGACNAFAVWVVRNPIPALIGALVLAIGVLGWLVHHERAQVAVAKAAGAQDLKVLRVEQTSNGVLNNAIDQQNAAVRSLGTDSARAVAQGKAALNAALARSATRAAASAQIAVPAAAPLQADCRTPDSVMAVKGKL